MRKPRMGKYAKACAAGFLSLLLAFGATGCKSTDFFTEILISSQADVVDENNANKTIINSPDAEQESSSLSALKWSDESKRSEDVQNLVVWSSDPNSVFTTHRSIFDLQPLFPGIEASEGVRLVFDADAEIDHETETESTDSNDNMVSVSTGAAGDGSESHVRQVNFTEAQEVTEAGDTGEATESEGGNTGSTNQGTGGTSTNAGSNNAGDSAGGDSDGKSDGTGESSDPSDDEGKSEDKYAGFGGSLTVFDSNNAMAEVPHVDHVAVIGKQVAVLTQAIGGQGAICAMSRAAYYDEDPNTSSTFQHIFYDECDDSVVVWDADDATIKETDTTALVNACSGSTLIVYDQSLGDQSTFFTQDQLRELYGAGVRYVLPVDFSTVDSTYQAAYMIGQTLSESKSLTDGWSSASMASAYTDTIDSLARAVMSTHDSGQWVYGTGEPSELSTTYPGNLGSGKGTYLRALIATNAATGCAYTAYNGAVNASSVVLYGGYAQNKNNPLGFWMQTAGVADTLYARNSLSGSRNALTLLWGTESSVTSSNLTGSGGAYTRWKAAGENVSDMLIGNFDDYSSSDWAGGLGSKNEPYLIVSGDSDGNLTGTQVKQLVVNSMSSGSNTPYTAYRYTGSVATVSYADVRSSIGDTMGRESENPFYSGVSASDAVRVNPSGLLGSWTSASFESLLESVWLASLYSQPLSGSKYTASKYDWSSYSITIGDTTITGAGGAQEACEETVEAFYTLFYRCDAGDDYAYSDVVTDRG